MDSLKLNTSWDLELTPGGNLKLCSGAERVAQDVACYERTFYGEPWFAQDEGVPYLNNELGSLPPKELIITRANDRAKEVPNVVTASTELTEFAHRTLHGFINVTTDDGETVNVAI